MSGKLTKYTGILLAVLILMPAFSGCTSKSYAMAQSSLPRDMTPNVPVSDLADLVDGNTEFAIDLYNILKEENDNLFFSPFSISESAGMVFAGARNNTEAQMSDVFHFGLDQELLHPAFNRLDLEMISRAEPQQRGEEGFQLHIANAVWGQFEYAWVPDFLDTLAVNYGAGIHEVDFTEDPEECRTIINDWVEDATDEFITDLIPQGMVNTYTRMILVNAIYFNAVWNSKFEEEATHDEPFTLLDGSEVNAPLMRQEHTFKYFEQDGWQAIELLYEGRQVSMVIILPELDMFEEIEDQLNADFINEISNGLSYELVFLVMPKFKMESSFSLAETLSDMGMPDAFAFGTADFSGMDGTADLFVSDVVHKAYIEVNEERTIAAAATGWGMELGAVLEEPISFRADHPFIFYIRDIETGAVLFLGRVLDPG